jgi:hypothetical protein
MMLKNQFFHKNFTLHESPAPKKIKYAVKKTRKLINLILKIVLFNFQPTIVGLLLI